MSQTSTTTNTAGGVGAIGLIWAVLIGAKLFEAPALVGWSWWVILTFPFWAVGGIFALIIAITVAFVALGIGFSYIASLFEPRRRRL